MKRHMACKQVFQGLKLLATEIHCDLYGVCVMLLLLFKIGENQYGIEITRVKEVWPWLPLKPVHRTPDYVVGLISRRGQIVPVVDLSRLYINEPVANKISTRIILVTIKCSNEDEHMLGLLAEHVTDTIKVEESAVKSINVNSGDGVLVGEEMLINNQLIQKINVDELLQANVCKQIFSDGS